MMKTESPMLFPFLVNNKLIPSQSCGGGVRAWQDLKRDKGVDKSCKTNECP